MSLLVCGVKIILWGKDWGKKWGTESNKITKALNALIGIGCFYVGEINILYANL